MKKPITLPGLQGATGCAIGAYAIPGPPSKMKPCTVCKKRFDPSFLTRDTDDTLWCPYCIDRWEKRNKAVWEDE